MEKDLFKKINNELDILGNKCNESTNAINSQTDIMNGFINRINKVGNQLDISKWHLNNISATFSKVHSKINKPSNVSNNNIEKDTDLYYLNNNESNFNLKNVYNKDSNNELDTICNKLDNIYHLSVYTNNMIIQQNNQLENNTDLLDIQQNKLLNNRNKLSKLLTPFISK